MKGPLRSGSIERNAFWSSLTNAGDAFTFVVAILAGRVLGTTDFGAFSFALALSTVFLTFANFGMNQLAIRDVARATELAPRYLGNMLAWISVLAAFAYAALLVTGVAWLPPGDRGRLAVAVLGFAVLIRVFSMTGRAFLQSIERFDVEAAIVLSEQILLLIAGCAALLAGGGLLGLCAAYVVARLAGVAMGLVALRRHIGLRLRFEGEFIRAMQIKAVPIGLAMLVMSAYLHADTLVMSKVLTFDEVGLYNAAFKVYVGLFIVPSFITAVLFPRLSRSFTHADKESHNRLLVYGVLALAGVALPMCLVGIPLARFGITTVFGAQYEAAAPVMQILLGVLALTFQVWLLRIYLLAINRQMALLGLSLFGLACRVLLDLLLIPRRGITGAALAAGLSEALLLAGIWIYLIFRHFKFTDAGDVGRKLLASLDPTRRRTHGGL